SDPNNPRWYMVDIKFVRKFDRTISLQELKQEKALDGMKLLQRGNRLSVMPVEKKQWQHILKMEKSGK
ncbi:MAG: EVE domain-containing protein, partial [Thiohalophilus sp.]